MVQVKEFSDTTESNSQNLEKNINQFLRDNQDIKLIDIKYSQSINGYADDIDSTSHALVIYEVNDNENNNALKFWKNGRKYYLIWLWN